MRTTKWSCTPCGEKHERTVMDGCPTCTACLCPDCKKEHTQKECDYLKMLLANCGTKWKDQDLALI